MSEEQQPDFPAEVMSHGPSGSTPTCARHSRMFAAIFGALGASTVMTVPGENVQCQNCINEWKSKRVQR